MTRTPAEAEASRAWRALPPFAVAVTVALLAVRPGRVAVDGDARWLVDPGRALSESIHVWDADRALGTVAAGRLGEAWPFGVLHWLADLAGAPPWVAQRLVLVLVLVSACAGVLRLAGCWRWRPTAAAAAAVAYGLAPFLAAAVLDRSSLLHLAGLPWLVALTVQAARHRGWRHPALYGLVLATVGSGDAVAAAVLVAVSVAWVAHARWITGEVGRARAITTVTKLGITVVAVNAWWVAALTVESGNGIDAARFGTPAEIVNRTSSAPEVLRGLGRSSAYVADAATASERYTQQPWLLAASFVLPVVALLALGVTRWRHRAYLIVVVAVGTVLAVGPHPGGASPFGAIVRALEGTSSGLGLRGLQEATVVVVLGSALAIGALVGAAGEQASRRAVGGAVAVAAVAVAATLPAWTGELVPGRRAGDEVLAPGVAELARLLDGGDDTSRVLELPSTPRPRQGTSAAAGLDVALERGHVRRAALPAGSAATTDLVRAIDRRARESTLAPAAIVPLARMLGVGTIVARPADWPGAAEVLAAAPGIGDIEELGDVIVARVPDPVPLVRTHPADRQVLLGGSGDGIVDAAAAGLLTGDELVRFSSTATEEADFARTQLRGERTLVVTDTNRLRAERWTGLDGAEGHTEADGGAAMEEDPFDLRLAVQPDREGARSVLEPAPLVVRATSYGPRDRYRTDQRPALAADGDPGTAWSVPSSRAEGERIQLLTAEPSQAPQVRLLQSVADGAPAIERVVLRLDDEDEQVVALDGRSRTAPGQLVDLVREPLRSLELEIDSLAADDRAGSVGFAEIDLGGIVVDELVRMPSDLLDAAGFRSSRYPLSLVQTRLRTGPGSEVGDEEVALRRIVDLPATRTYRLAGRAHVADGATVQSGACRNDLVAVDGAPVPVRLVAGTAGDLRIEGCEPDGVLLPGGDRRFTTAPGTTTGVHVDQLVWTSDPLQGAAPAPPPADAVPDVGVSRISDTTIDVTVDGVEPGRPLWVVLASSFDPGWAVLDPDGGIEIDGPHLVDGYANGFLVTPDAQDLAFELRFVPQNRVDVALLVSAVAALVALALALPRPQPVRPAAVARQEPLRRIRAFTYEGALPSRRDAIGIATVALVVGTFLAGPLVGIVLAAVGGIATRHEGWRAALTLLPAGLLAFCACSVLLRQVEDPVRHSVDWPLEVGGTHLLALTAVLLLVLDVVVADRWRRGSLHE